MKNPFEKSSLKLDPPGRGRAPLGARASTARAESRRFGLFSALHAHTKAPCKPDLL